MKKVFELNSPNLNEIIIDKNRYFLKIKNTDDILQIAKTFQKIVGQNFNNEVEIGNGQHGYVYSHHHSNYYKNKDCGKKWTGIKLKGHNYGYWAIEFENLYKAVGDKRWNRPLFVPEQRFNNDLIIEHGRQEFRFIVTNELEFPISKYLKYIKDSFKATEQRKKEKDVKKFVSSLTWMGILGDFQNKGWYDINLKKCYDEFSYSGNLANGQRIEISLQKNSEEDNPLFTIWLVKGQLGKNINKETMMLLVESLLVGKLLEGKKDEE